VPLTMKDIVERRLNSNQEDWKNNYFDTCDAIVQLKGKIKIIKNCKILKDMNKNTELEGGAIKVTEQTYRKLKGKEFDTAKLKLNEDLSKEEVKKHPIWKYLIGNLLNKYIDLVFKDFNNAMYIWVDTEELNLRAWYVDRLDNRAWSDARASLGSGRGRFAGVAPEAQ
ncbi:hypothetical protein LCGC14_2428760, partial [marine sediment metagenome]